jgi:hypothetical protein
MLPTGHCVDTGLTRLGRKGITGMSLFVRMVLLTCRCAHT